MKNRRKLTAFLVFILVFSMICTVQGAADIVLYNKTDETILTGQEGNWPYHQINLSEAVSGKQVVYESKIQISGVEEGTGSAIAQIHAGFQAAGDTSVTAYVNLFNLGLSGAYPAGNSSDILLAAPQQETWYQVKIELDLEQCKYRVTLMDEAGELIKQSAYTAIPANSKGVAYPGANLVGIRMMRGTSKAAHTYQMKDMRAAYLLEDCTISLSSATSNGKVTCNDQSLSAEVPVKVEQGSDVQIKFVPEEGYQLKSVLEGERDVTALVQDNALLLEGIQEDKILTVAFESIPETAPSVVKTAEINTTAGFTPEGSADPVFAAVMYAQINSGYGYTVTQAGAYCQNSSGSALFLPAIRGEGEYVTDGHYGIRVYGGGFEKDGTYMMIPAVKFIKGETEGEEKGEAQTFEVK